MKKLYIHGDYLSALLLCPIIFLVFGVIMYVFLSDVIDLVTLLLPAFFIGLFIVAFCLLNYREMFKKIHIHDKGMDFYLRDKMISSYIWDDILSIDFKPVGIGPKYCIIIKGYTETIWIEATNDIKAAINMYTPEKVYNKYSNLKF